MPHSFAASEQECTSGIQPLPQPEGDRLCQSGKEKHVSEQRLVHCTPAQWDALEARAIACMRAQLVRYHLRGGFDSAADYDRSLHAWELIVMNRQRQTGKA